MRAGAYLWAKTNKDGGWHPLLGHLLDTATVAGHLWDNWLPRSTQSLLAHQLGSMEEGRALTSWIAGLHDLGKASPAFQHQVAELATTVTENGLQIAGAVGSATRVTHAVISGNLLMRVLQDLGWREPEQRASARRLAVLLNGHHGRFTDLQVKLHVGNEMMVGDSEWYREVKWLFEEVSEATGAAPLLERWSRLDLGRGQEMVLAGIIMLSDWVASNEDVMEFISTPAEAYASTVEGRVPELGFRPRWNPSEATPATIERRFGFPAFNELQRAALEVAHSTTRPGLTLIEAPMGEGKTEGAFITAEVLAAKFGAGGIFLALPTQAASNQMFTRTKRWLDTIEGVERQLVLVHGKAVFNPAFAALREPSNIAMDECEESLYASVEWFCGSKRQLLAPFIVGTVDHLLLAAKRANHVALRMLGLAGKIVIVDEVHAYDAHMLVFLHQALGWLGELNVPVVLLSATLSPQQRTELLSSYTGVDHPQLDTPYPAIVSAARGAEVRVTPVPLSRTSILDLTVLGAPEQGEVEGVRALLKGALVGGGCVAVICNTVRRAQQVYLSLEAAFPGEVSLFHSRFVSDHRARIEREVLVQFGREGRRPYRHILVATQVVEHSLDLDFDLMISDLAPLDLLLQRSGRLHRHPGRARPALLATPRLIITGMELTGGLPRFPRGSEIVYQGTHLLLRTASWLRDRPSIAIPGDIPAAVSAVYGGERMGPEGWQKGMSTARVEHDRVLTQMRQNVTTYALPSPHTMESDFGLLPLASLGGTKGNAEGGVRGGDTSIDVIPAVRDGRSGEWRTMTGVSLERDANGMGTIRSLLGSVVPVPRWYGGAVKGLSWTPEGWSTGTARRWLEGVVVLPLDNGGNSGTSQGIRLGYSDDLGIEIEWSDEIERS